MTKKPNTKTHVQVSKVLNSWDLTGPFNDVISNLQNMIQPEMIDPYIYDEFEYDRYGEDDRSVYTLKWWRVKTPEEVKKTKEETKKRKEADIQRALEQTFKDKEELKRLAKELGIKLEGDI